MKAFPATRADLFTLTSKYLVCFRTVRTGLTIILMTKCSLNARLWTSEMSYTSRTQQYKRLRGDEEPTKDDCTFTDISTPLSLAILPQQITSDDLQVHPLYLRVN